MKGALGLFPVWGLQILGSSLHSLARSIFGQEKSFQREKARGLKASMGLLPAPTTYSVSVPLPCCSPLSRRAWDPQKDSSHHGNAGRNDFLLKYTYIFRNVLECKYIKGWVRQCLGRGWGGDRHSKECWSSSFKKWFDIFPSDFDLRNVWSPRQPRQLWPTGSLTPMTSPPYCKGI